MIDYILSRLDIVLYVIVFFGIYFFILYLWRKIAVLETSVFRLDKAFTSMIIDREKEKYPKPDDIVTDTFNNVFNTQPKIVVEELPKKDLIVEDLDDAVNDLLEEDDKNTQDNDKYTKTQLNKMTVEQVKDIALKKNLNTDGTKTDIINRILS